MYFYIQKLISQIINIHCSFLKKKSGKDFAQRKTISSYTNSTTKKAFAYGASLELTSKTNTQKTKLENNLTEILRKCNNNPEKLLNFINKNGTKVYKIKYAKKYLKLINYEDGIITATNGFKGLYLNLLTSICSNNTLNLKFETEQMIIIDDSTQELHTVVQLFHKWYAMKLNLPGFDEQSQSNFQKFLYPGNDDKIKDLTIDEILGLKEAIARDVEAINFVVKLAKSTSGSKNALKKMLAGGATV